MTTLHACSQMLTVAAQPTHLPCMPASPWHLPVHTPKAHTAACLCKGGIMILSHTASSYLRDAPWRNHSQKQLWTLPACQAAHPQTLTLKEWMVLTSPAMAAWWVLLAALSDSWWRHPGWPTFQTWLWTPLASWSPQTEWCPHPSACVSLELWSSS